MARAYTLITRPKNLPTTATIIHHLRHHLRIQRVRHISGLPSHPPSAHPESDKRRPRVEDEWLEASTSQSSPCELVEIEDKGKHIEQRYGNVNVYRNSVMEEASSEEQARRKAEIENKRRRKRQGRVFENTEQLYKAYHSHHRNWGRANVETVVPERTSSLSNPPSMNSVPNACIDESDCRPIYRDHDDGSRYVTLTENTSVVVLNTYNLTSADLTWNSALSRILASPYVDFSVSSMIKARARARACDRRLSRDSRKVNMGEVSMVPNFSYPIPSARWWHTSNATNWPFLDGEEPGNNIGGSEGKENRVDGLGVSEDGGGDGGGDDASLLDLAHPNDTDGDSLYRATTLTPSQCRVSDPGSVLRDILDPKELEMYQEIMSHNPRFTVLLNRADGQISPCCEIECCD